jgi:phosphoserine phosphatase
MSNHPLQEISQFVASHKRVAVVFDLDSTLFCVSPRTQAILRQLGNQEEFGTKHAELAETLKEIEVLPTDWGIRQALERAKAKGSHELLREIRNYWGQHFFANHFLDRDLIYPAANEYVRHLKRLGAEIIYLTGREDSRMREGTERMLKHWGFPLVSSSDLLMKPSEVQTDEGYKVTALKELISRYAYIWFIENEPLIINEVRASLPQIRIVFMNSVHSGKAEPPTDLPTIRMTYRDGLP